jgi:hypothetical protein
MKMTASALTLLVTKIARGRAHYVVNDAEGNELSSAAQRISSRVVWPVPVPVPEKPKRKRKKAAK